MSALEGYPRRVPSRFLKEACMKKIRQSTEQSEPLGIIISNGDREEPATVFSAYIWGPAPEPTHDPASKAA